MKYNRIFKKERVFFEIYLMYFFYPTKNTNLFIFYLKTTIQIINLSDKRSILILSGIDFKKALDN